MDSVIDNNFKARYSPPEFENYTAVLSDIFINNVSRIYEECNSRGIMFIVANQQKNSDQYGRVMLRQLTYQEEVHRTWKKLLRPEEIDSQELRFLGHSVLMEGIEKWTVKQNVPFVDLVEKLDQNRNVMVSEVHLGSRGNRMIVEMLFHAIDMMLGRRRVSGG